MKICFSEENDVNFIRWAANLLLPFFREGSITAVRQTESPDAMIASIWRNHEFRSGLPVILVTNENWKLFPPSPVVLPLTVTLVSVAVPELLMPAPSPPAPPKPLIKPLLPPLPDTLPLIDVFVTVMVPALLIPPPEPPFGT